METSALVVYEAGEGGLPGTVYELVSKGLGITEKERMKKSLHF